MWQSKCEILKVYTPVEIEIALLFDVYGNTRKRVHGIQIVGKTHIVPMSVHYSLVLHTCTHPQSYWNS